MVGDNGLKRGRMTERVHSGNLIPVFGQHENNEEYTEFSLEFTVEFMDYGQDQLLEELERIARKKLKKGRKKKRHRGKKL